MRPHTFRRFCCFLTTLCAPLLLAGCPDDPPAPPAAPVAPTAAATATATVASSAAPKAAAPPAAKPPVCRVINEKSWAKGVNPRTGITATYLADGKIGVGVALGNRPQTLMFDGRGQGVLKRVKLPAADALAKRIEPGKGVRHLQRVTVASNGASFADYRDKYKDGERRRIACGPTNGGKAFLLFDGKPMLDVRPKKKKPAAVAGKASASAKPLVATAPSAKPKLKLANKKGLMAKGRSGIRAISKEAPVVRAGAAPSVMSKEPAKAAAKLNSLVPIGSDMEAAKADAPKELREIRDCRSFTDGDQPGGWAVGSELIGTMQPTGQRTYQMQFFTQPQIGSRHVLHKVPLGAEPKKLHTFEAPVARRVADGSYVLATRYRGRLMVWQLGANKKSLSALHRYAGGYPSLPRIIPNGDDFLLLSSQKVDPTHWKARFLTLAKPVSFPPKLNPLSIGGEEASVAEPTLARAGDSAWLAYHLGDRRRGQLYVAPVDDKLAAAGRSFAVSPSEAAVYESHLFGLDDGQLLAVYILRPKAGRPAELVSKVLKCEVEPE